MLLHVYPIPFDISVHSTFDEVLCKVGESL